MKVHKHYIIQMLVSEPLDMQKSAKWCSGLRRLPIPFHPSSIPGCIKAPERENGSDYLRGKVGSKKRWGLSV